MGDGTETTRSRPVTVTGLGGAVARLSLGYNHSCINLSDGRVQCWGDNRNLQLGDGTRTNKSRPVFVLQACPGTARADCTDQLTGVSLLVCDGNICYAGADVNDVRGRYWGGATTPSGWAGFAAENTYYFGRRSTSFGEAVTGYLRQTMPGVLETRFYGRSEWGNGLGGFTYSYPVPAGVPSIRGATISTEFTQVVGPVQEQMPSCGLKSDGVYCWGRTAEGRLAAAGLSDITPVPTRMSDPGPLE